MPITLATPDAGAVPALSAVLATWQRDDLPLQLHPGDLGWASQGGMDRMAAHLRTWHREGALLALGMLDGPDLIRLALAPEADADAELAAAVVQDLADTSRGVLPEGDICVEARHGSALRSRFLDTGWEADDPWTHLSRDLSAPLPEHGLRIAVVGPEEVADRVAIQNSAFASDRFTADHHRTAFEGPLATESRDLVGYDDAGAAVAMATVWSAGIGRPGIIEPLGAHADHRGRGHGRAMTVAAMAALQEMGSSSAAVATTSANTAAVAAYASAGMTPWPQVTDFRLSR